MSFYGSQTKECKVVLETLVWYGDQDLASLEKRAGKRISVKEKGTRSHWEPFQLVPGLELLLLEYSHSYGYHRREVQKSEVVAFLPDALHNLFRKAMPKPAAYTITALKRRGKAEFTHTSESTALGELALITDFIRQGHLPLKKNGAPMVKGLRTLVQLSRMQEFYPPEAGKEFEHVKIELLTSFLLGDTAGKVASNLPPHKLLHTLFAYFTKDDKFLLTRTFLKHLRIQGRSYYYYNFQEHNIKKDLKLILQHLPLEKWVSLNCLLDFCLVRGLTLNEREISAFECYMEVDHGYSTYSTWETINQTTLVPLVCLPVLQAFFFLSAALGMVEIAYNQPENPQFQRPNKKYLSIYDGLRYVRLTQLGAYVTGKKKSYTPVEQEQQETVFTLDNKRLLLTMEGNDPIAALTLKKMLTPLGTGRFIMTHESLFSGCRTHKDVQNKIRMFKKMVANNPPQNWKEFFSQALKRINPLTPEHEFKVMKVGDNEELLNLLASDPEINPLIRKVEGLRIAVNKNNLSKLNSLLRKHGFLVAGSTLAT